MLVLYTSYYVFLAYIFLRVSRPFGSANTPHATATQVYSDPARIQHWPQKRIGYSNHQWKIWLWFHYFQSSNKTSVLFALLPFKWLLPYYVSEDLRSESLFYDQKYGQPNLVSLFIFIFHPPTRLFLVIPMWYLFFMISLTDDFIGAVWQNYVLTRRFQATNRNALSWKGTSIPFDDKVWC